MKQKIDECNDLIQLKYYEELIKNKIQKIEKEINDNKSIVVTCPSCGHVMIIKHKELDEFTKSIEENCYDYKFCPECKYRISIHRSKWNG